MPCPAIKQNGEVCGKRCREGLEFCGVHANLRRRNPAAVLVPAPAEVERRRQAEQLRVARERLFHHRAVWTHIRDALQETMNLRLGDFDPQRRVLTANPALPAQQQEYLARIFPHMNAIVAGIYDGTRVIPIVEAITLAEQIRREAPGRPAADVHGIPLDVLRNVLLQVEPLPQGELARFVADRQNVHTEAAVKQTKDIIDRVLRIPVPADYKSPHLKTMGEIVLECPLTKKAAWQFSSKYCADEDIYEYGAGVYARVADCVWQYIKNSSDKADLCKIFALEMEDSIGMCAQGNLTRLCNVLAGYLEGINMESPGEQMQQRMANISKLPNAAHRLAQGRALLAEFHVPPAEWAPWLEALE